MYLGLQEPEYDIMNNNEVQRLICIYKGRGFFKNKKVLQIACLTLLTDFVG